jgi:hypothetical protein
VRDTRLPRRVRQAAREVGERTRSELQAIG